MISWDSRTSAASSGSVISRVPRTLALVFSAIAMSVCGVIMQMITQNKFVEPTTAGTSQWAGLGVLVVLLVAPGSPPLVRMGVASVFALVGTLLFLAILRRVRSQTHGARGSLVVPLVGMMLGAVVGAIVTFLAAQFNLLQSMAAWRSGGYSSIVAGFYEPLWAVLVVAVLAWIAADRFTVVGLGRDIATNAGLNYERTVFYGTCLVAIATGITAELLGVPVAATGTTTTVTNSATEVLPARVRVVSPDSSRTSSGSATSS